MSVDREVHSGKPRSDKKCRSQWEKQNLVKRLSYEGVTKSFWTDRLEREQQMVQFSATTCSCIAIF